jgi:electron transfer flavoprotein beta subunit
MGLHIVVCIKQTPATSNIQIDPATGTLKREGMAAAINPFDAYAIEEAVRIKERLPGTTVSVITMGPPQAEDSLREAIACGADQAFHLTSRAFAGADTWATSYTIQMGIRKIMKEKGPVHLVICGKQTNDGDTGHVGPGIAAWLDWPNIAYVKKVEAVDDKKIVVHRMMEDGVDVLEMDLPAVLAVVKGCLGIACSDIDTDEDGDEGDGENDEEDGDGADEEIFQEPRFVLRNASVEFREILPEVVVARDGAEGESLPVDRCIERGIGEEKVRVVRLDGEESEILRRTLGRPVGEEEAVGLSR